MEAFFYKILFRGLLACAGLVAALVGFVSYKKMWLTGASLADLGPEGNFLIFMGGLVIACLALAWRIKAAMDKL